MGRLDFPHVIDLYRPDDVSYTDGHFDGMTYPSDATFSEVRVRFWTSKDANVPKIVGASNADQMDTTDRLVMLIDQECDSEWYAQNKTPGHPELDEWYVISGNPQVLMRAGTKRFLTKKTTEPPRSA